MMEQRGMARIQTATTVARWVVGITGVTQVLLGILFWTGRAVRFLPLHMVIGLAFVLAMWTLAGLAVLVRTRVVPALVVAVWGIVVLVFGMNQSRLLPGPNHWIVKVLHLLVGFAAMALAGRLTAQIRNRGQLARSLEAPPRRAKPIITKVAR